jgi:Asp-tRNA(Asn)/Glu-tRNA(Gln) amidotransferase A subunit family amidase
MTIAEAARRLRAGSVTSRALVEASLTAIETHNASLKAFITVDIAGARAAADAADRERRDGIDRGPLHGIPISIKDIVDQASVVTTAASHVLDDRRAPCDATVVSRLTEAGAVIIGRANLHQFALGTTSEDSAYGAVRNPRDTSRVAGGSSGGSAAAVASGMGLASVGTDTGASIRVPAAVCGIVGLKGTIGEVPTDGVIPLSSTLDHVGPLARSVQDAAWMWQVMSSRPPATIEPTAIAGLRLARLADYFEAVMSLEVRAAYEQALGSLAAQGVALGTALPVDEADAISSTYADIVLAEGAQWHGSRLEERQSAYLPSVHARLLLGRQVTATTYIDARLRCSRYRLAVDHLLDSCDALVLPTLPIVAPPVGTAEIVVAPGDEPRQVRAVMLRLTQLFNLTGHPAISIPIATGGLPVGLQLVGRRDGTAELLRVAAAVERALGSASPSA